MKNTIRVLLLLIIWGCNGQIKKDPDTEDDKKKETQPVERSEVHREYDEFGNLIKYDSIYVWSYSNKEGDSVKVNLDSIMDTFKKHFEIVSPFGKSDDFKYFPKQDSILRHDFFKEDYYFRSWEHDQDEMKNMMKKMDSMRNQFLKDMYPGLLESKIKPEKKI